MSHIVQVVSIELVPIKFGTSGFQSKEVRGAENSLSFLRFNFCSTKELSFIYQIFRVYPEVANKSGLLFV